jgi:hypothetical protein
MAKQPNRIRIEGDVAFMELRRKDGSTLETKISTIDVERVQSWPRCWGATPSIICGLPELVYVTSADPRTGKGIRLHRFLMGQTEWEPSVVVDHINGDTLDNRRANLRVVHRSVNRRNTSKVQSSTGERHIHLSKYDRNPWYRVTLCVGAFETLEDAVAVRDRALEILRAEFPHLRY